MATTSGTEVSQAGPGVKAEGEPGAMGRAGEGGPGAMGKAEEGGPGAMGKAEEGEPGAMGKAGEGGPGGPGGPGGIQPGGEAIAKAEAGAGATPGGPAGPGVSEPLQGFAKKPEEEAVKAPPMVVAKVDQAEIAARKAQELAKRELADVYFAFDKWALSSEGRKNLAESAEYLKQNPEAKLLIEGHCDERGSREYNLVLGEKRAKETRRYLMDLGVKNPVVINSFGKERPVCTEHDESCYWKNRRAHLVIGVGK
jgi:peptidoglycan-associated lipoprotein